MPLRAVPCQRLLQKPQCALVVAFGTRLPCRIEQQIRVVPGFAERLAQSHTLREVARGLCVIVLV